MDRASLQHFWRTFLTAEVSSQLSSATSSLGLASARPQPYPFRLKPQISCWLSAPRHMRASIQPGQECGPGNPDAPTEDVQAGLGLGLGAPEDRGCGPLQGVLLILCSASLPHSWSLLILCQGLGPALLSSSFPLPTPLLPSHSRPLHSLQGILQASHAGCHRLPPPGIPCCWTSHRARQNSAPPHTRFSVKPSHFCPL